MLSLSHLPKLKSHGYNRDKCLIRYHPLVLGRVDTLLLSSAVLLVFMEVRKVKSSLVEDVTYHFIINWEPETLYETLKTLV